MNYQIITDADELKKFIQWLPELKSNEMYFVALFARSKYVDGVKINGDKAVLKRITSNKEMLFNKIRQMECPVGSYAFYDNSIPQESLAVYINPTPRDLHRATIESISQLNSKRDSGINPHKEVLSCVQSSKSKTRIVDFDMDCQKNDLIYFGLKAMLADILGGEHAYKLLETRGGYHILVDPTCIDNSRKKSWYVRMQGLPGIDATGDNLIPIPGTYQGGFTPKFI